MLVSYDKFINAFLNKITEYDFVWMNEENRDALVTMYLTNACSKFYQICKYDIANGDDDARVFDMVDENGYDPTMMEVSEIVNIISDGMVCQWLEKFQYAQENMQNMLSTSDFSFYSPAELLKRMTESYTKCQRDYINAVREYSFAHGDLTDLHT